MLGVATIQYTVPNIAVNSSFDEKTPVSTVAQINFTYKEMPNKGINENCSFF